MIVDFWAPWCGPCKQLTPTLEKVVREARGAVRLVKINTDENQELAQQMRVQSIPAVFAFVKGRPVNGFAGAQPESQVKSFVQRLIQSAGGQVGPSPVEQALEQAEEALARDDAGTASAIFAQVIAHEPNNVAAIAGLAKCHIGAGNFAEAKKVLDRARGPGHERHDHGRPHGAGAGRAIETERQPDRRTPPTPGAESHDHQARLDLAMALYGGGQRDQAIEELLDVIRRDRRWNEEAARKQLVKLFEALGPTDPLTISARRRLSSLLFS